MHQNIKDDFNMRKLNSLLTNCLLGAMLLASLNAVGCKTPVLPEIPKAKQFPWSPSEKEEAKPDPIDQPARLSVIWTDAVYNEPGKEPTRGFGGRIFFFNDKNKDVRVEGEMIIYAYNDSAGDKNRPVRRYVFKPEQFARHFSESPLGRSYSVWVPWDAVGGPQAEVSLVPVFRSTAGQVLMGQHAMNVLPGDKPTMEELPAGTMTPHSKPLAAPSNMVQQINYVESGRYHAEAENRMRTTTIDVTPALKQQMQRAASQRLREMSPKAETRRTPQIGQNETASSGRANYDREGGLETAARGHFVGGQPWKRSVPRTTRSVRDESPAQEVPVAQPTSLRDR